MRVYSPIFIQRPLPNCSPITTTKPLEPFDRRRENLQKPYKHKHVKTQLAEIAWPELDFHRPVTNLEVGKGWAENSIPFLRTTQAQLQVTILTRYQSHDQFYRHPPTDLPFPLFCREKSSRKNNVSKKNDHRIIKHTCRLSLSPALHCTWNLRYEMLPNGLKLSRRKTYCLARTHRKPSKP